MKRLFSRFSTWAAVAGFLSLVLFVRAAGFEPPMPDPPLAPPRSPFSATIVASGIVEASRENTRVGVPFAGLVSSVEVAVWQRVKKGEILLRLDDAEPRAQCSVARAELAVREAELRRARRQYDRLKSLRSAPSVAAADVDASEDAALVAEALVDKARAAVEESEATLERYLVRSPIDATVLQVNVRAAEHAAPGSVDPPMVLGSIDELQIRAEVDEQLAAAIRSGARAVAYHRGHSESPLSLRFVRIEPYIVPKRNLTGASGERVDTRVLQVVFAFQKPPSLPTYVGQQVEVFIEE
jgi:HlyD family secretion protein